MQNTAKTERLFAFGTMGTGPLQARGQTLAGDDTQKHLTPSLARPCPAMKGLQNKAEKRGNLHGVTLSCYIETNI